MKIIEILKAEKNATDEELKSFIYKNFSQEMIIGLEYDDPKTIKRALKLFGINYKEEKKDELST
ncbi:MAG: hypothetical protein CMP11_05540 [Zetaproteobacteria bacterium]|nr:hypothetical protein [Pseudobdellovibrionaceae bacterium]|tara:strand:+ start:358 stop:549 length:192 start_codon:yes stop_codon:yes gene_type:complete